MWEPRRLTTLWASTACYRDSFTLKQYQITGDISVDISMGYGMDDQGSIPGKARDFSLLHSVQTDSGAHPASYKIDTGGSVTGIKQPGLESDNSPPRSRMLKLYLHSPTHPHS
jgi:hypothetical protein